MTGEFRLTRSDGAVITAKLSHFTPAHFSGSATAAAGREQNRPDVLFIRQLPRVLLEGFHTAPGASWGRYNTRVVI